MGGWSAHDWRETRGIYVYTGGKPAENSKKKKESCLEYSKKVITWNRQFWGCSGKSNYHQQIVLEYLPKKEYSKKGYYKFLKILGKFPKNNY